MLVKYSDWKKPTDHLYRFVLRAPLPIVPAPGTRSDIRDICATTLEPDSAERFNHRVRRWDGPEGYASPQLWFQEQTWTARLSPTDIQAVLAGTVRVMRRTHEGRHQTDYILRDHHMLDVVLYHFATSGTLPEGLFHADRHSDWCRDSYLETKVPDQAATWWKLLEGLKRPGTERAVLEEKDVCFATAQAARTAKTAGRDVGASVVVPYHVDPAQMGYPDALSQSALQPCDWVSLDLDYFQPWSQWKLSSPLLREPRFHALWRNAAVRVLVLSPQFTRGGDRLERWIIQGSVASSLRLMNWLLAQN